MESAYNWLRVNVRCLDDTAVLVHGDYSLRNVLLDGDRVSAILDWELCSVSHPAEDLAYMRPFIESVMPWEEYLAAYHMHTRFDITNAALSYFDVWAQFWQVGIAAAAYSGYSQNKHRNFIFASVACVEYRERSDRLANLIATL
jgi:aminoglycoside phosphotransferase (APT) family kinase protein